MRVIVLGSTGSVGRSCVDTLLRLCPSSSTIIASSRTEARVREEFRLVADPRLRLATVDLDDPTGLSDTVECEQPDLVANCAGPSHRYSAQAAEVAARRGVAYVDAGGDRATIERTNRLTGVTGGPAVFGAGVQPGLAGVAIRAVAALLDGPGTINIDAYCGGLQPLTPAGLDEYLHSVETRTGHPGTVYDHGRLRTALHRPTVPPSFPLTARAHISLDEEAALAAEQLRLASLQWANVMDSPRIEDTLARALGSEITAAEALEVINTSAWASDPYFRISATGRSGPRRSHAAVHCTDSAALTGAVTALAALEPPAGRTGARWFSESVDPVALWERLDSLPGVSASTWSSWNDPSNPIEDGEL